jgi:GT2 family glycosyltransferase
MLLSIIIVHYKTPGLLLDCLQTICRPSLPADLEIIVVDNYSNDDTGQRVAHAYPEVRWIQMDYNSGFARANNEGMRHAKGDTFLLLNSDTLNENNAIEKCFHRFATSEFIAASVQLLNADRSPQISGNYFMTGGLNHLMALPYAGRMIRWVGLAINVKKTNVPSATGTVEVDWINGAFLMVKRSAVEKAGMMDEDFFLYSEEIEWCSRLQKAGKLCIYGDLHIVHLQGASAGQAYSSDKAGYAHLGDRKGLQIMLSGLLRIRKQFGVGWLLFHVLAYLFTIPFYFLMEIIQTVLLKPSWNDWWGFSKNVIRVLAYMPEIISNKRRLYKIRF